MLDNLLYKELLLKKEIMQLSDLFLTFNVNYLDY